MNDLAFLLFAALVTLIFVVSVLASNPEGRNPHTDTRRHWWRK